LFESEARLERGRGRARDQFEKNGAKFPPMIANAPEKPTGKQTVVKWKQIQLFDKTTIRHNISYHAHINGPSHAAQNRVNQIALSAFSLLFDKYMIHTIIRNSNNEAVRKEYFLNLSPEELLRFIEIRNPYYKIPN
jgi:hypothetical protein